LGSFLLQCQVLVIIVGCLGFWLEPSYYHTTLTLVLDTIQANLHLILNDIKFEKGVLHKVNIIQREYNKREILIIC